MLSEKVLPSVEDGVSHFDVAVDILVYSYHKLSMGPG